ncbi:MAG: hypothetical protein R2865_05615 [Deinococcales bacterium]
MQASRMQMPERVSTTTGHDRTNAIALRYASEHQRQPHFGGYPAKGHYGQRPNPASPQNTHNPQYRQEEDINPSGGNLSFSLSHE